MSCSTKITATFSPASAAITRSISGNFSSEETPEVGSSRSSTRGWLTSAMAMSINLRTPPGSCSTGWSA